MAFVIPTIFLEPMPSNSHGAIFDVALHPGIINKDKGSITQKGWKNLSLKGQELLYHLVEKGEAFIPAKLQGETRRKDQFASSSLVVLDFDGASSYLKTINDPWVKKYGLFAYTTHSHNPLAANDHFRLAIGLDQRVLCSKEYESIVKKLIKRFGSDPEIGRAHV